MARPRKITAEVEPEVLALAAQGWSGARIAKRLESIGISISAQQVGEFIRRHRSERADVAKVVVREHIEKTLPADLVILDDRVRALTALVERLEATVEKGSISAIVDLMRAEEQLRKTLDLKLHYVGADQPDTQISGLAELVGLAFKS